MEWEVSMKGHSRPGAIAYWALVVFLIAYGFLGLLSVGLPFLLLGITLAILSQRRHETGVIAAGVASIVGFTLGYLLVAPLGCTTSASSAQPVAHTVCTNILGIDYSGAGIYSPSLVPGLLAGIVVAVAFALGARWVARRIAPGRTSGSPTVA
jgi:membrane-bound ClpP family serine protease